MITLPVNIPLHEWADIIVSDLDEYGTFARLDDVKQWQDWATQFLNNVNLAGRVPNPKQFDNWQDWAERLCQTLG